MTSRSQPWKQKPRNPPGLSHSVRSGFEEKIALDLVDKDVPYEYEPWAIPYEIKRTARYTPDFVLANGIIIEAKGIFFSKDRSKHLLIKEQRPDLDIRFVLSSPGSKIRKGSKTTVGEWLTNHGFIWAKNRIPESWIKEDK